MKVHGRVQAQQAEAELEETTEAQPKESVQTKLSGAVQAA
jgi:hypothetical protein